MRGGATVTQAQDAKAAGAMEKLSGHSAHGDGSGSWDGRGGDGGLRDRGGWSSRGEGLQLPPAKLGLWLFLAAATVLFTLLVSAYLVRMGLPDWGSIPKLPVLWLNTGLLLLSSLAFERARRLSQRGEPAAARWALWPAGGLALSFGLGQLWAWKQLSALGYFLASNPASSFFYLLTALHGLHLLGGLVAWGRTTLAPRALRIELCAIYWHFLRVVWLGLLGLIWLTS